MFITKHRFYTNQTVWCYRYS